MSQSNDLRIRLAEPAEAQYTIRMSPPRIAFYDATFGEVAVLEIVNGELRFSGNLDQAATMFFVAVKGLVDDYIREERRKGAIDADQPQT